MRVRAIITDIDSTLVDNRRRKVISMLNVSGIERSEKLVQSALRCTRMEDMAKVLGLDLRGELLERVLDAYLDDIDLYSLDEPVDGAVEVINELADEGRLIIYVSGRPGLNYVLPSLLDMGFPRGPIYTTRIKGGPDAVTAKVELMRRALTENSLRPGETVSLGDMPHDGLASRELGIFSVGTVQLSPYQVSKVSQFFDRVISHISELRSVIRSLESESD
ncbi:MAG: hypothetical protein NZ920_00505 [Aigarchaeota archaeon]|nr:hypothetical protein [Aigarchaeota archaeon]MDW8092923.1 hypothetical protein [Nitrososphaerota archaeon]